MYKEPSENLEEVLRMKKTMFLIATLVLVVVGLLLSGASAKVYKIGVTQIITHPAIDSCRKGFTDQMKAEGFVEGQNVQYDFRNPEGDMSLVASIAKKFVTDQVDLIFTISTPSTQACVAATKSTDIPVIFGAMTDPVAAKVVDSWEKPGGNCTGMSDWTDIRPQLELIKEILPKIMKIGTVYNSGESNSLVQVAELKKAIGDFGIANVVEATAATTADVHAATMSLAGKVEAIWIPTDNTVVSSLGSVVKVCEEKKIPLFAVDTSSVEKGCISAIGFSYYELGREAGKITARVLKGAKPSDIPVGRPKLTDIIVNSAAAKRMGVTIPDGVMKKASKIVEE
jgi:putative ABC transport system substrate-binding protein